MYTCLSTTCAMTNMLQEVPDYRCGALQGELVVANVFVRVYNEQPTFPVSDPAAFCKGLVSYLHMQAQSAWLKDVSASAPAAEGAPSVTIIPLKVHVDSSCIFQR